MVFAESPSAPGVPIVYRLPEERQANPDRLNLDRCVAASRIKYLVNVFMVLARETMPGWGG